VAGLSEDDVSPDAVISDKGVFLRGEYDEGTPDKPGNGRVYYVTFRATDALGASTVGKVKVIVPTGILPTDKAYDDGQKYDSLKDPNAATKKG